MSKNVDKFRFSLKEGFESPYQINQSGSGSVVSEEVKVLTLPEARVVSEIIYTSDFRFSQEGKSVIQG